MDHKKIEKNWDDMSYYYEAFTEGENSFSQAIEMPIVDKMLPSLNNKKVLDLGCGTGRFTFEFERQGPSKIIGIDLSETMLDIARYKGETWSSSVKFLKGDVSNFKTLVDDKFDFIFSSTTLHFIEELKPVLQQMYDVLEEKGTCILSLIHPVFSAQYPVAGQNEDIWDVRYLDQRERAYVQPWIKYNDKVDNYLCNSYHHTFSDYINSFLQAGFKIDKISEPGPPASWEVRTYGKYENYVKTPTYMIVKLYK